MAYPKAKIAMIQMRCDGSLTSQQMLDNSIAYVDRAVAQGARLVVFPECFPTDGHFKMDSTMWRTAEPWSNGKTERTFGDLAKRHKIYICTTVVLVDGLDFFNVALVLGPSGEAIAKNRKNYTTGFEAFFWQVGHDTHIVDTELGRIGVGICAENHMNILTKELVETSVSLVVSLHSVPDPLKSYMGKAAPELASRFSHNFNNLSTIYSKAFGCPAAFINKVGSPTAQTTFGGMTAISANGQEIARVPDNTEGIAIAEVELIPSRTGLRLGADRCMKLRTASKGTINDLLAPLGFTSRWILKLVQGVGHIYYTCSPTRRHMASRVSGASTWAPNNIVVGVGLMVGAASALAYRLKNA